MHSGWGRRWRQALFALTFVKYLRKDRYPLFSARDALRLPSVLRMLRIGRLPERDGAYFPNPTLPHRPSAAFDHMVAQGGLNLSPKDARARRHIGMALMAISRRCDLSCEHCYERFNIGEDEAMSLGQWRQVLHDVQAVGAGVVVFTGGEPMLRYGDLLELLRSGDKDRSDFHVHSSGHGVTARRARELRASGLVAAAIGLDDADAARHDALRGFKGAHKMAVEALRAFHDAGVLTYTNLCLTPGLVRSGGLRAYFELARELEVAFIQLLEPRPCGGYAHRADDVMLTEEDRKIVTEFFVEGNEGARYADYPVISYVAYNESPARLGCGMGGLAQIYIDSKGNVNPCVFLPVAFGNVTTEPFDAVWRRMRESIPRPFRGECPAVSLAPALRAASVCHGWPVPHGALLDAWTVAVGRTDGAAGSPPATC